MGDHDLNLSPIGFGAFKIGRNQNVKYPDPYDLPDDRAVETLLNGLLDLGINYIDTAPAYGSSEERIGAAIGYRRAEYTLSTKVGESFEDGKSVYDFSADAVRAGVERSLRRLRTDVLDIVFVHSSRGDLRVIHETDIAETLAHLRDEGLVKRIGFSGHTAAAFRATMVWADAIMVQYHLNDRSMEPIIAEAAQRGIAVIVKKGLDSGTLASDEATRFVLSNPGVTSLAVGGLDLEHMRQNLEAARKVRASGDVGGAA